MGDNKSAQQPDVNEQIKVRMEKLKNLQDAGKDPFQITKYDVTHHTDEIRAIYEAHEKELLGDRPAVNTEGLDEQQAREAVNADYNERRAIMDASPINVSFAGRMMFKRVMGKASFCNIADLKGRMQAYISRDAIGEEAYADFKKSDIGDIFGILSGACTVVITASVTKGLDTVTEKLVAVAVSAIISAIIVGGKAALKNLSITKSTELVIMFSKVLSELLPEKRKKKKKR